METAKERNERTREEHHQAKFDRWAQRQAAKRSRTVLEPVGMNRQAVAQSPSIHGPGGPLGARDAI